MHLPDFVLLVIGTLAAIAAGLAVLASNYRVARVLLGVGASSFWSLGVVWSATSEGYSLPTQLIVSAVIGAIAAAGLSWALWEIRVKEKSESHPTLIAVAPKPEPIVTTVGKPVMLPSVRERLDKALPELLDLVDAKYAEVLKQLNAIRAETEPLGIRLRYHQMAPVETGSLRAKLIEAQQTLQQFNMELREFPNQRAYISAELNEVLSVELKLGPAKTREEVFRTVQERISSFIKVIDLLGSPTSNLGALTQEGRTLDAVQFQLHQWAAAQRDSIIAKKLALEQAN